MSLTSAETTSIAPGGDVKIVADNGDVKIRTWKHNKVAVRSEAVHQAIIVSATNEDGEVVVNAKGYTANSPIANAIHTIYVPEGTTVDVDLTEGELTVDDTFNTLNVSSGRQYDSRGCP